MKRQITPIMPGTHSPRWDGPRAVRPRGPLPAKTLSVGLSSWFISDDTDQTGLYSAPIATNYGATIPDYAFGGKMWFYLAPYSIALYDSGSAVQPIDEPPYAFSFTILPDPNGSQWSASETGSFTVGPTDSAYSQGNAAYVGGRLGWTADGGNFAIVTPSGTQPITYVCQVTAGGLCSIYGSDGTSSSVQGGVTGAIGNLRWGDALFSAGGTSLDYILNNLMVWPSRILTAAERRFRLGGGLPSL